MKYTAARTFASKKSILPEKSIVLISLISFEVTYFTLSASELVSKFHSNLAIKTWRESMYKVKWTAVCILAGLLAILLLQNTDPVETRIFFTSLVMPRAFLLLLTAFLGFVCGVILTLVLVTKKKSLKGGTR